MPRHMRSRLTLITAAVLAALAVGLSPWASPAALAATFTVANLNDSGAGSLRQAILDANASPAADTITFAPATNGGTIVLASALPALANAGALTIAGNGAANTTVSGNNAVGVFVVASGANVTIRGIRITGGNAGAGTGGGISNNGTLTLVSSNISGNVATDGGGIYSGSASALVLTNSSVSSNIATDGGGIFAFGSTLALNNSTLNANSAAVGGGIFLNGSTATLHNTIIANSISGGGNDCARFAGTLTIQNSLIEDGSCGIANGVNGNLIGDPALGANLVPSAGSIAIDAGLNSLIPAGITADLAGNARIQGARVDMGAFESGLTAPPTLTPSPTPVLPTAGPGAPPPTPTPGNAPATATPKPRKPNPTPAPLGRITGTVINLTTGAPVPGIKVQVGDAVVVSDPNGNYDRNGLAAGDYPVQLLLEAGQGEPAQGVIVVTLPPGATVVQHLALRTPLPTGGGSSSGGTSAEPTAVPAEPAAPAPTAAPAPAELPRTAGAGGFELLFAVLGLVLVALGLSLSRRRL